MFNLPNSTIVNRSIPKELIYEKFSEELSGKRKHAFDTEISKITITNEISELSVDAKAGESISAIFVLLVELNTKIFSNANIELLTKLLGQKILIVLNYKDEYRLAIYEYKLLLGKWKKEDEIALNIQGTDLELVWENLVKQVIKVEIEEGKSLQEQLAIEANKNKLRKLIEKTERQARKGTQAKKSFELYKKIQEYKEELESM